MQKTWLGTAKTQLSLAHRTVRWCTGQCPVRQAEHRWTCRSRKIWRHTVIIHRTVWWCTRLSDEPTAASATVGRAIRGRRVTHANGRQGHRTVRCALDSFRCANQPGVATVGCARIGRRSRTGHEQWLSGGAPDCPVHPTEGKNCLPCWPPTAPSCIGAIKETPRRMEELSKHSLSNSKSPHSVSTHLIDRVSDLSSVLAVNSLCFIWAQVLACVRVCAADLWVLLTTLLLCFLCDQSCKGERLQNCEDSSQTGKDIRKNTVVFKLIIGSLERGWVQPSSIGTPQCGGRQVLHLAEPRDKPLSLVFFCDYCDSQELAL
jgi:hypothetical protein